MTVRVTEEPTRFVLIAGTIVALWACEKKGAAVQQPSRSKTELSHDLLFMYHCGSIIKCALRDAKQKPCDITLREVAGAPNAPIVLRYFLFLQSMFSISIIDTWGVRFYVLRAKFTLIYPENGLGNY